MVGPTMKGMEINSAWFEMIDDFVKANDIPLDRIFPDPQQYQQLGTKVMLNLWVKVKRGWSDDERALKSLGYDLD